MRICVSKLGGEIYEVTLKAANVGIFSIELELSVAAPGRFHSQWLPSIHITMLPVPLCMNKEFSKQEV